MSDHQGETPSVEPEFQFPEDDHPLTVLTPTAVVPYCYLYEALLWVAVQRLPFAEPGENGDRRVETNEFESTDPPIEFMAIDDEECERCGLPPNPEYAAIFDEELYSGMTQVLEKLETSDPEVALRLAKGREFEAKVKAWDDLFEDYLDLPRSRLFIALREGKIDAVGKPLPSGADDDFPASYDDDEWLDWVALPWQRIAASDWTSSRVNWEYCRLVAKPSTHTLIQIPTGQLLAAFPPVSEPAGQAVRIGSVFQIVDQPMAVRGTRGRRPFDWDGFHLELAKRVRANTFPSKQEALVAEMQAWCERNWGRRVGRSTLVQKIGPYYAAFFRQS